MKLVRVLTAVGLALGGAALAVVGCSTDKAAVTSNRDSGNPAPDAGIPTSDLDAEALDGEARDAFVVDPAVAADIERFGAEYAQAVCERATACCNTEEYNAVLAEFSAPRYSDDGKQGVAPPAASCVPELQKRVKRLLDRYAASALRGRMGFEKARAQKCVDDMKATVSLRRRYSRRHVSMAAEARSFGSLRHLEKPALI
jgi:hypothetical protein